jgi:hypothetical protein
MSFFHGMIELVGDLEENGVDDPAAVNAATDCFAFWT